MLVFTLGDPHSVNIELAYAWLAGDGWRRAAVSNLSLVVVGSQRQWRDQERRLALQPLDFRPVTSLAEPAPAGLGFLDVDRQAEYVAAESMTPRQRGRLSVDALEAIRLAPRDQPLAVVTGPIDKHACRAAGFPFPGQTELFEALWEAPAVMILAGPRLRVGLVTNHLRLAEVAAAISAELVEAKLIRFARALAASFGIARPRIAVCGLNPHASDQGLFGDEEARCIAPAITAARAAADAVIDGPLPADTAFYRSYSGAYDGVLAMYHDQGLGPLKTVHFDDAINLSGGLPHLRVAPDHGPAADLFLTRRAAPASLHAAFDCAARYLAARCGR